MKLWKKINKQIIYDEIRAHWLSLCFIGIWFPMFAFLLSVGAQIFSGKLANIFTFDQVTGLVIITFSITMITFMLRTFHLFYDDESEKWQKKKKPVKETQL